MAKFIFKTRKVLILRPETQQIVIGSAGPQVVVNAGKSIVIPLGMFVTVDEEVIARIRRDSQFGSSITEYTAEDEEAVSIRTQKAKEAEEEIKTRRAARKK